MSEPDAGAETFATQLQRLFEGVKRDDGSKYTPREVAEAVTHRGHNLSKGYIYDLLKGKSEPSHSLVQALADFFQVPLDYFSNTERGRELNHQYEILAQLGESNVRHIAHRASQLSPDKLQSVLAYLDFEASRSHPDNQPPG